MMMIVFFAESSLLLWATTLPPATIVGVAIREQGDRSIATS
jgi:hypothetical protein